MVVTENPVLITNGIPVQEGCIIRGDLMKLLAGIDTMLLLISCQKSHQARHITPNKRTQKIGTSIQMREILYTLSRDMLVLLSTIASRYYNCCTVGSTSP
jgi:hypothetical protein